ncbi:ThuA domain-containing protein [Oleiharenicola lentus]|jgi:type 1 glutamine amidotransferase|uniref:ThuA domain-containing protein n=1 Tax=Oleiharenicola lentus TaxID=2508720 RepID=A0A4Q1C9G3_9BACT|nr:ThuA domain-containing protein [Oleiharenicola lentus]RXK55520.1 ThuA domain-containing protein [Oleiharenicola lentus]
MKLRYPRSLVILSLLACAVSASAAPLRVLYFTKSSGYEHSVIKQDNGNPSYSEKILTKLGEREDIVFTTSKDGSKFSPEYLAQFDVLLFYTSGDLTSTGNDRHPGITTAGLSALFDFVANGGGFVGLHACSDTFHTMERGGGNNPRRLQRYRNYGAAADPFVKMLGGEFIRHGPQQVAIATITDRKFPGFDGFGDELKVNEEWYTLKDFMPDLRVLLVMQTAGMEGGDYARPPYPLAWARPHGKGRVAYNAMGHREDVWDSAYFQSMLAGMLKWAGNRAEADVTPNLEKVAPQHATIQAPPAEVKQ